MIETKTMLTGSHVVAAEINKAKGIIERLGLDLTVNVENKNLVTVTGESKQIKSLFTEALKRRGSTT